LENHLLGEESPEPPRDWIDRELLPIYKDVVARLCITPRKGEGFIPRMFLKMNMVEIALNRIAVSTWQDFYESNFSF
jgi:hypothetical protein